MKIKKIMLSVLALAMALVPTLSVDARAGNAGRSVPRVTPRTITPRVTPKINTTPKVNTPTVTPRTNTNNRTNNTIIPIPIPINRVKDTSNLDESIYDKIGTTEWVDVEGNEVKPKDENQNIQRPIEIEGHSYERTEKVNDNHYKHVYSKRLTHKDNMSVFTGLMFIMIVFGILVSVGLMVSKLKSEFTNQRNTDTEEYYEVDETEDELISRIQNNDPGFDVSKFKEHVKKSYLIVTNAWTSLDMTRAHQYVTSEYADTLTLQLQEFINNKTRNVNEGVEFRNIFITDYNVTDEFENVEILMNLSDVDYIVDRDNNLVEGTKERQYVILKLEFVRQTGSTTKPFKTDSHCKQCHAPLKLDISGKCEYCDTLHEVDQSNWLLNNITALD